MFKKLFKEYERKNILFYFGDCFASKLYFYQKTNLLKQKIFVWCIQEKLYSLKTYINFFYNNSHLRFTLIASILMKNK